MPIWLHKLVAMLKRSHIRGPLDDRQNAWAAVDNASYLAMTDSHNESRLVL